MSRYVVAYITRKKEARLRGRLGMVSHEGSGTEGVFVNWDD
jgi:hypothetical protein